MYTFHIAAQVILTVQLARRSGLKPPLDGGPSGSLRFVSTILQSLLKICIAIL